MRSKPYHKLSKILKEYIEINNEENLEQKSDSIYTIKKENKSKVLNFNLNTEDLIKEISGFEKSKPILEQYTTDIEINKFIQGKINKTSLSNFILLDQGSGTGKLSLPQLINKEVKKIICVEKDINAIKIFYKNIALISRKLSPEFENKSLNKSLENQEYRVNEIKKLLFEKLLSEYNLEKQNDLMPILFYHILDKIIIINSDLKKIQLDLSGKNTIVVQNPPFGTRNKGIDLYFLKKAMNINSKSKIIYSIHKTSTKDFLKKEIEKYNPKKIETKDFSYKLEKTMKFHQENEKNIETSVFEIKS